MNNRARVIIISVIVLIAIILFIFVNENVLGFNTIMKNGSERRDTNEPFICPYNSESEKNNAKKPISLPLELKKLNNINTQFEDSSFSMEQVFGGNGAKTQLITDFEYKDIKRQPWEPIDDSEDFVPHKELESTEDLRYGNPDVDGYSLCDVNPSDSDDYYDPKLMNVKLKSSFKPLILNTSDQIELIGASQPGCAAKDGLCKTSNTVPVNSNPILDIIRGTDNPLPGPFSGRYKKCK